jgi:hypothetical protein
MKLADLTKDQLIAKLKATKRRHRTTMKALEQIHTKREARIGKLEAEANKLTCDLLAATPAS